MSTGVVGKVRKCKSIQIRVNIILNDQEGIGSTISLFKKAGRYRTTRQ
jgi:hypothetical protein